MITANELKVFQYFITSVISDHEWVLCSLKGTSFFIIKIILQKFGRIKSRMFFFFNK